MSSFRSTLCVVLTLAGAPALAAQTNPISDAFRGVAGQHGKDMLAAAEAMPADKYGFKPTPAQRTFGQLVLHIAGDSRVTCSAILGVKPGPKPNVTAADSKETLVATLRNSLTLCDSALAQVTDAKLADPVMYYGQSATRVQALVGLVDDWSDHYSTQAVYLRLNGILPPSAKRGNM
ncbi:MAG: DinB family protein [Gemmatimonadales bacterium]